MKQYDVLIIGSGLAGMSLALRLAETQRVALLTKNELLDAASDIPAKPLPMIKTSYCFIVAPVPGRKARQIGKRGTN